MVFINVFVAAKTEYVSVCIQCVSMTILRPASKITQNTSHHVVRENSTFYNHIFFLSLSVCTASLYDSNSGLQLSEIIFSEVLGLNVPSCIFFSS